MAIVDEYMAAFNAHDAAKAAGYLAADVTYIDMTIGQPLHGRDSAEKNVLAAFINAVPDCVWTRKDAAVVGAQSVAFEWTYRGTNTGAWADGTKATGKKFSFDGVTVMRFDATGAIVYQADYYDALGFYKQLGWAAVGWPIGWAKAA